MVQDPVFWQAMWNNFLYALFTIPASVVLAMLMALWVNQRLAGRGFLRMSYFVPTVLPLIAVANIWLFFYVPDYGLVDVFTRVLGFGAHSGKVKRHCRFNVIPRISVATGIPENHPVGLLPISDRFGGLAYLSGGENVVDEGNFGHRAPAIAL